MNKRETRVRSLPLTGVFAAALLSTACFTPADFGAGVAAEEHGEAPHGDAAHDEQPAAEGEAEAPAEVIVEGIVPGTEGKTLSIEKPEIVFEPPFDGKPLSTKTLDNGVVIEEFVLGEGEPVTDGMLISFNFKGYADATGRLVMGSRAAPSKLAINETTKTADPLTAAMTSGFEGMMVGGKRRVKIPAELVEESAPPGQTIGDLVLAIDLVSAEPATKLEGTEAYSGTPVNTKKREDGLEIYDYRAGEGRAAKSGDKVVVHYIGELEDGTQFDSSHAKPEGMPVVVGGGGVIKGFSEGVEGAKAGMLRKVVIPPALGYGDADRGKIPPNSTLVFYLQVMEVSELSTGPQTSVTISRNGETKPEKPPKPAKPAKPAKPEGGE